MPEEPYAVQHTAVVGGGGRGARGLRALRAGPSRPGFSLLNAEVRLRTQADKWNLAVQSSTRVLRQKAGQRRPRARGRGGGDRPAGWRVSVQLATATTPAAASSPGRKGKERRKARRGQEHLLSTRSEGSGNKSLLFL